MNDAVWIIYSMMTSSILQVVCAFICACFVPETVNKKKKNNSKEEECKAVENSEEKQEANDDEEDDDGVADSNYNTSESSKQEGYTSLTDVYKKKLTNKRGRRFSAVTLKNRIKSILQRVTTIYPSRGKRSATRATAYKYIGHSDDRAECYKDTDPLLPRAKPSRPTFVPYSDILNKTITVEAQDPHGQANRVESPPSFLCKTEPKLSVTATSKIMFQFVKDQPQILT
jgi:hypothetical protein